MIAFVYNEEELESLISELLSSYSKTKVFVLDGELGAGKTTFVKYFCQHQGISDAISSPTFSLVNEYRSQGDESIFHMDLYRISDAEELIDMGFEDYLDTAKFLFIEWADYALPFLDSYLHVKIETIDQNTRKFILRQH
ncbi:tRNA (adenosine(37)-N6)-threonylcarbamoyltransferase complex ATPase subunit type 1 TsaE [Saprospiraceae bacterium]|nr:tRNA (adenosine(37)-N6)-threonylcarbamoyltransferase complex ATPase subunit type 1 TsaE [Saprospiraceae bacterium]